MKKKLAIIFIASTMILTACSSKEQKWEEAYSQGIQQMKEGEYEEAIDTFTEAIEINPEEPKTYVHRGTAYLYESRRMHEQMETDPAYRDQEEKLYLYLQNADSDFEKAEEKNYGDIEDLADRTSELEEFKTEVGYNENDLNANVMAAINQLDYAMFVAALQEMGCCDVMWELQDAENDGTFELYVSAMADENMRENLLIADVDGPKSAAQVATGAAGASEYITCDGYDSFLLQDGYYSAGNTNVDIYEWNGSQWSEISEEPENIQSAEFSCLDLKCQFVQGTLEEVTQILDENLKNRDGFAEKMNADLDNDGVEEKIYILKNAADPWFESMEVMNCFGDELYLDYKDDRATAIVVSSDIADTEVTIRMSRLEAYDGGTPEIKAGKMILDGVEYDYQTNGEAFVTGEIAIADIIVDGRFIEAVLPSDWEGKYVYEFWEEGNKPDYLFMSFYEKEEHELTGAGHLFTICMAEASVDTNSEPSREDIGILYAESDPSDPNCKMYNLYVSYPTDVQAITDSTREQYQKMTKDIDLIISSISAKHGSSISFYGR